MESEDLKSERKMDLAGEKSKKFAIRIVRVYQYLRTEKKEFVMSKQLLRSGTSIGANLAESKCAISRNDFASKVYIALKETAETLFWLELLHQTEYLTKEQYLSLYRDATDIRNILSATTRTIQRKL